MTVEDYLAKVDVESIIYTNKIPLDTFVLEKIPRYNPLSMDYRKFWLQQLELIIDGTWVEHEGLHKWVPGVLYFYANHWHILLNEKGAKSKTKTIARPMVRDLEWIKFYLYVEARGFSGFENDDEYTCLDLAKDGLQALDEEERVRLPKSAFNKQGKLKAYKTVKEYLWEYKSENLGKAIYDNEAKNVCDLESRGTGKSFTMSGLAGHNFLTDGANNYEEFMKKKKSNSPLSSETLIGAVDTKYSGDLIKKIRLGLETLEGEYQIGNKLYPSPISRKHKGSWESGKTVIQEYDVKIGGEWKIKGTKSKFQHRSFKDNPFAANGTRGSVNIIDEIGFMGNIIQTLGQMVECTADSASKFGTIWMTGTGGDMEGDVTSAIQSVFYDPGVYDCIGFDDHYEGSANQIGFFIPAWMGLNQFKDDLGNTNVRAALHYLLKVRAKKAQGKNKDAYNNEMCQRPILPSEVFLISGGNLFNVADLKTVLNRLEGSNDPADLGVVGRMDLDSNGEAIFTPDLDNELRACSYPVKHGEDQDGAVVIWEQPNKDAGYGLYLGGIDPYDQDKTATSVSLGSLLVMRRASPGVSPNDQIVAEYTARPETATEFFEQCRRLLLYYGMVGTCLYENEKMGIKTYFDIVNSLYLLASTPSVLKANRESKVDRQIGQHMSAKVKVEAELMLRDWLKEPAGNGTFNWQHIKSVPLLKELISYNDAGNFDRVIAMMLCVLQMKQMHHIVVEQKQDEIDDFDEFFSRQLFNNINNTQLWR